MITIIKPNQERFRTIPQMVYWNFPKAIDVTKLVAVGILNGDSCNKNQPLNMNLFDSISYLGTSKNVINKKEFIHALGHIDGGINPSVLILKL